MGLHKMNDTADSFEIELLQRKQTYEIYRINNSLKRNKWPT